MRTTLQLTISFARAVLALHHTEPHLGHHLHHLQLHHLLGCQMMRLGLGQLARLPLGHHLLGYHLCHHLLGHHLQRQPHHLQLLPVRRRRAIPAHYIR